LPLHEIILLLMRKEEDGKALGRIEAEVVIGPDLLGVLFKMQDGKDIEPIYVALMDNH
ncbi:hypothetical protein ACJX0J_022120, partial [Zea mays]